MDTLYNRMTDLLANGRTLYMQMTAMSREKRDAISQNKIDELDRIVRDEQNQLVRIQDWDHRRVNLVIELAAILGKKAVDVNMEDFFEACSPSQRPLAEKLYRELLAVVEEQASLNEINKSLIEQRLEYINMMVDSMQPVQDHTHGYTNFGGEKERRKSNLSIIDTQA